MDSKGRRRWSPKMHYLHPNHGKLNNAPRQRFHQSQDNGLNNGREEFHSPETAVEDEGWETTELRLPVFNRGAGNPSNAESGVLPFKSVISQKFLRTSTAVGQASEEVI